MSFSLIQCLENIVNINELNLYQSGVLCAVARHLVVVGFGVVQPLLPPGLRHGPVLHLSEALLYLLYSCLCLGHVFSVQCMRTILPFSMQMPFAAFLPSIFCPCRLYIP